MSDQQATNSGTLMRGADGRLYFIPDSALAPYAVPDADTAAASAALAGPQDTPDLAAAPTDLQARHFVLTSASTEGGFSPGVQRES